MNINNIPKPENKVHLLHQDGDTMDIVRGILKWDGRDDKAFCSFANQFTKTKSGLQALWRFVRFEIQYKEDSDYSGQVIQSPRALWHSRIGDCKSKTLFVNQVLRCLGIPYIIRFTSYNNSNNYTHVYSIAVLDGKEIILDTVYHFFDEEKGYSNKKDYKSSMVKITAISGLADRLGIQSEVQQKLTEIRQKQTYIPQAEYIPFSRLTVGEANTEILLQRLKIKKAMEPDKSAAYKEAINLVERQLVRGDVHRNKVISGVGSISNDVQPIAALLAKYAAQEQPAMYRKRKPVAAIGGVWLSNTQYKLSDNSIINFPLAPCDGTANACMKLIGDLFLSGSTPENRKYVYGQNSQFAKKYGDNIVTKDSNGNIVTKKLYTIVWELIKKYRTEPMMDGNTPILSLYSATIPPAAPLYPPLSKLSAPDLAFINNILNTINPTTAAAANAGPFSSNAFNSQLIFRNNDVRAKFLEDMRIASGVPDDYINNIFIDNPSGGLGNGFMYGFCEDTIKTGTTRYRIEDFPAAVGIKYPTHYGYISGCAGFVGMDESIIKNLARKNIAFNQDGKDPEQQLKKLQEFRAGASGGGAHVGILIGELIALLAALAALISALAKGTVEIINAAKGKAESIQPGNLPDTFKPIGPGLQFDENDWAPGSSGGGGGGGGGNNNNGGGGGAGGGGSSMLLWGGIAALGGWGLYEYSKSKKSKSQ